MRLNNRESNALRPVKIERQFTQYSPGSVLISMGETKVICTASIEEKIPPFLRDTGTGWVTAEYAMLPSATHTRNAREVKRGKASGRTNEIQRMIGRALRSIIRLDKLGERTIYIDCDVIQADGGTRTASITGGMVALWDAVQLLLEKNKIKENPIKELLAAVSVGVVANEVLLDLCYEEDVAAEVDMNVVMTESGKFVEVQGTAEGDPFSDDQLQALLRVARQGISQISHQMKEVLGMAVARV